MATTTVRTTTTIKVGRTAEGYRIRIEGRGTMRESPAVHTFTTLTLGGGEAARLVVDLSACDYLYSTFLGCLVDLYRHYRRQEPIRFTLSAPPEVTNRLFGPTHLDRVLHPDAESPAVLDEEVVLPPEQPDSQALGRHVLDCHRCLTEIEGPCQVVFRQIAERLARELEDRGSDPACSGTRRQATGARTRSPGA